MLHSNLNAIEAKPFFPGVKGKFIHGESLSWAFWQIDSGAEVPRHQHVHEQMMHVVSGRFEFEIEGEKQICEAGEVVCIASNQWHYGKALTDCVLMDVFTPVREEYR
jgi:Uncharacterized conserved protein, contains double-stranded beta-helix domain